jgi:hypothetical protein
MKVVPLGKASLKRRGNTLGTLYPLDALSENSGDLSAIG